MSLSPCFRVFVCSSPFFSFIVFGVLSAFEIWKVSERYLGGIWGLSRRCMEGLEFGGFRYPEKFGNVKVFHESQWVFHGYLRCYKRILRIFQACFIGV